MSRYNVDNFYPAPDPDLICSICLDVLDAPYETPCRHVFCKICIHTSIKRTPRCPLCRMRCIKIQCKEVQQDFKNRIDGLTMKCNYFDNECTDFILKESFLEHVKSCQYMMIKCRFAACRQNILKKDQDDHELNICTDKHWTCDRGCGLSIPVAKVNLHTCVESLVQLNQGISSALNNASNAVKVLHALVKLMNNGGSTIKEIADVLIEENHMDSKIAAAHITRTVKRLRSEGLLEQILDSDRYVI